jgi:hypothetical protein
MATTQELLEQRKKRIADAIALRTPDRVPCVPLGDAFAARVVGVTIADFCTKPEVAYPTMIKAFTSLGEIDGIQHASYNVSALSTIWLSKVKWPGRDLPVDELWQVEEQELMTPADYDAIIADGWGPWLGGFIERAGLGPEFELFGQWAGTLPDAFKAWDAVGIPVLSPVIFTIPYEYFCGGRSLRAFILDLHRHPDKVQAAMDATMPALIEQARGVMGALGVTGVWLGGWRSASEFLSPKLWERFVPPYYKADGRRSSGGGCYADPPLRLQLDARPFLLQGLPQGKMRAFPRWHDRHLQGEGDLGRAHVPHGRRAAEHAHTRHTGSGARVLQQAGAGYRPFRVHPGPGLLHPARRQAGECGCNDRGGALDA